MKLWPPSWQHRNDRLQKLGRQCFCFDETSPPRPARERNWMKSKSKVAFSIQMKSGNRGGWLCVCASSWRWLQCARLLPSLLDCAKSRPFWRGERCFPRSKYNSKLWHSFFCRTVVVGRNFPAEFWQVAVDSSRRLWLANRYFKLFDAVRGAAVRGCSGLDPRVGPDLKAICELWRWLGPNGTRPPATTPTHSNRTRPASARNLSTSGKLSCALHTSGAVSRSHDFPANTTQVSSPHFGQEGMAIGARRQFGLESEWEQKGKGTGSLTDKRRTPGRPIWSHTRAGERTEVEAGGMGSWSRAASEQWFQGHSDGNCTCLPFVLVGTTYLPRKAKNLCLCSFIFPWCAHYFVFFAPLKISLEIKIDCWQIGSWTTNMRGFPVGIAFNLAVSCQLNK